MKRFAFVSMIAATAVVLGLVSATAVRAGVITVNYDNSPYGVTGDIDGAATSYDVVSGGELNYAINAGTGNLWKGPAVTVNGGDVNVTVAQNLWVSGQLTVNSGSFVGTMWGLQVSYGGNVVQTGGLVDLTGSANASEAIAIGKYNGTGTAETYTLSGGEIKVKGIGTSAEGADVMTISGTGTLYLLGDWSGATWMTDPKNYGSHVLPGDGLTLRRVYSADTGYTAISAVAVPEPATIAIMASALVGLIAYAWRKRK